MSANFNSILLIVTYLDQANDAHDQEAGVRDLAGFSHCLRSVSHRLRQTSHFLVVGFCLETSFVITSWVTMFVKMSKTSLGF